MFTFQITSSCLLFKDKSREDGPYKEPKKAEAPDPVDGVYVDSNIASDVELEQIQFGQLSY